VQCIITVKFTKADDSTQDPTGGFVGVYRNFPSTHPDFTGLADPKKTKGLIYGSVPWRPNPAGPWDGYAVWQPDWYSTPSCLVKIDPAVINYQTSTTGVSGVGLEFKPSDFQSISELTGGAYALFTVEWEARINMTRTAYLSFTMNSNDDSWFFFDGILKIDLGGGRNVPMGAGAWMSFLLPAGSVHTIAIYYAERCTIGSSTVGEGPAEFYFGAVSTPVNAFVYTDPSELCAKKSFEDLLKHQAEGIESFEDLLTNVTGVTNVALNAEVILSGDPFFELYSSDDWHPSPVNAAASTIVNGVFLLDSIEWDKGSVWWDCHDNYNPSSRYITIDLGGSYCINSFIVQADNNDEYGLYYWDGSWVLACTVQELTGWGMLTRYYLTPTIITDKLKFEVISGDYWFSVSEIQAYGVPSSTPELLESFENLTKEQEDQLKSFEDMIESETPQWISSQIPSQIPILGYNESRLLPAEFINLLDSFEYLLHKQCDIKESFIDLFNESRDYLRSNSSEIISSIEGLIRSDSELLNSFENLTSYLFNLRTLQPKDVPIDQLTYFLESYEQLLESQSQLIGKFEGLVEWLSDRPVADVQSVSLDNGQQASLVRAIVAIIIIGVMGVAAFNVWEQGKKKSLSKPLT